MESISGKKVLVSGASIAGLSTACLLHQLGYNVTVVERASGLRTAGTAVDIREMAVDAAMQMGILEQLKANRLTVEKIEVKNADDGTENTINVESPGDEIEIERDKFLTILFDKLKDDVAFVFNNRITTLAETNDGVDVAFSDGTQQGFDLVIGCDGLHSGVRTIWFGPESEYAYFLEAYFSITIVNKLLINQKTMQMYNEPDKTIILNAYNNKTDIIFFYYSEKEIPYDYRDVGQQRQLILEQFVGQGWRTAELLTEMQQSDNFYFDKFCQVKMPSWTKGRVALVGDAGYCASPAAGMGASLSMIGAATLANALEKHSGKSEAAFQEYNQNLRPFTEKIQAIAESNVKENFILRTEEAIRERNAQITAF